MGQDVVCADELHLPAERVQNIGLLGDELLVAKGHTDVLKKLLDTWVGHLVVFGGNEDAGCGDQSHDLVF